MTLSAPFRDPVPSTAESVSDSVPSAAVPVPSAPAPSASVSVSAPSVSDPVPSAPAPSASVSVPSSVVVPCDVSTDELLQVSGSRRQFVSAATGHSTFAFSPFAVFPFRCGDVFCLVDYGYSTRRILLDTATFEMYCECFYADRPGRVPKMLCFPPGRGPLPATVLLDPSVPASKLPVGVFPAALFCCPAPLFCFGERSP